MRSSNFLASCTASLLLVIGACGGGGGGGSASNPPDGSAGGGSSGSSGGEVADGGMGLPPFDDGGVQGRSSIGWAVDYPDDVLNVIGAHTSAFTHVAVLIYDVSNYKSGVAPFWNTPGGGDVFQNNNSSATLAEKVHTMGLKMLAGVFGGQELGSNQGIVTLLNDTPPGTQAGFITSMVNEGVTKKYDGFALDWAMGGATMALTIDFPRYAIKMQNFLGAFRSALHAKGMVLTLAMVPNDVKQACISYGNGVFDLQQLGKYVDLAMMEAYGTTFGSGGTSCPKNYTDPPSCFGGNIFAPFTNDVDLLCANTAQMGQMTVMMSASPQMTNPFAGQAMALVKQYGIPSVSLFPEINTDKVDGGSGPDGTYAIFDSTGISPAGTDWFALLTDFLAH
jgi:hypothetical protein